jgi:hypothetical protein
MIKIWERAVGLWIDGKSYGIAIAVISTIGTIASVRERGHDASPKLKNDEFVVSVPGLDEGAD